VVVAAPVSAGLDAPSPPNRPPPAGAAAGVVDGVADVVPPRLGNSDFCGVSDDVVKAVEGWLVVVVVVVPRDGKAGFDPESALEDGILKSEDP
jgi:hypothetical protein